MSPIATTRWFVTMSQLWHRALPVPTTLVYSKSLLPWPTECSCRSTCNSAGICESRKKVCLLINQLTPLKTSHHIPRKRPEAFSRTSTHTFYKNCQLLSKKLSSTMTIAPRARTICDTNATWPSFSLWTKMMNSKRCKKKSFCRHNRVGTRNSPGTHT